MKSFIKKYTPDWALNLYHYLLALLGALIYRFPGYKLEVIGITGTNGKTTTVHLLSEILERAGYKTASISSLRFKIGKDEWPNTLKMTMPGRLEIQKFLHQAVKSGCTHAVMEVTSEGIKQHRHQFIPFKGAVLTNITKEHIESHGSFANYKKAKKELFRLVEKYQRPGSFLVVNLDDGSAKDFMNFATSQKFGYTLANQQKCPINTLKCVTAKKISYRNKISFEIENNGSGPLEFTSLLYGQFNVSNILAAICAAKALDIRLITMQSVIKTYGYVPGRLETVMEKPIKVVVDYAHTPDALQKVYETLSLGGKKLICVLGAAGGGRDKWKRPELGALAGAFFSKIIITNEDPYDENPEEIIKEVAQGAIQHAKKPEMISDRKKAILKAIKSAKKNQVVIITGKGAEPWLAVANGEKIPWDDREVVRQAWKELQENSKNRTRKKKNQ